MEKTNSVKKGSLGMLVGIVVLAIIVAVVTYIINSKRHEMYCQRYTDIVYGSRHHNTYDLFLPYGAAEKDSLALILYIHGGSWRGGDKEWHHDDCYKWVRKGYALATMNYSLLSEEGVSWPTMLDEIERCTEHIVKFAGEHGANICQMAITGSSAGGHLAMMFAYKCNHSLPLRFVAIKVGPSDFRIRFPYDENASTVEVENFVFNCTGKHIDVSSLTWDQLDSIKLLVSPIHYINDSTALPALWGYGEKDHLIIPDHYRAIQKCYDSLCADYTLIVFPNSDHNLLEDGDYMERYDNSMNEYCKKYFGY